MKPTWTLDSYIAHNEALREAESRLQAEREKRYTLLDDSNKQALAAALASASKADEKAEKVFNEYKVGANEWRDTVKDLIAVQQGRAGGIAAIWAAAVTAIGIAMSIAIYLK